MRTATGQSLTPNTINFAVVGVAMRTQRMNGCDRWSPSPIHRALFAALLASMLAGSAAAMEADCAPQTKIDAAKINTQIVLVGESHGTKELPAFTAGLVCSLLRAGKSVILAVERNGEEQEGLNRYLDSEGGDSARDALLQGERWQSKYQDGRASQAMLELIESMRALRQAGQRIGVLALGRNENLNVPMTAAERAPLTPEDNILQSRIYDRAMADNLLFASILYRTYVIVALTGHSHTAKGYAQDPEFLPMGYLINQQAPTFIIGFETGGGMAWSAGGGGYKERPIAAGRLYREGTKIDAVVFIDMLTASPSALPRP